jgi:hypothetical protein
MKTLISSLLLMAFSIFTYSLHAEDSCAFPNDRSYSIICQISSGLQKGVWEADLPDQATHSLQFHKSGQANWFVFTSGQEVELSIFDWELSYGAAGEPVLLFSNASESYTFEVVTACSSLGLKSIDNNLHLELRPGKVIPAQQYNEQEEMLKGHWGNTITPLQVKTAEGQSTTQAYLKYSFEENGRFVRWLGNSQMSIKEEGNWMLAKDGKHVIFQFDNGRLDVSALKYINMDELVLERLLQGPDEWIVAGGKSLFFNRN